MNLTVFSSKFASCLSFLVAKGEGLSSHVIVQWSRVYYQALPFYSLYV